MMAVTHVNISKSFSGGNMRERFRNLRFVLMQMAGMQQKR